MNGRLVAEFPVGPNVGRGVPSDDIQDTSAMADFPELAVKPTDNEDRLFIAPDRAPSLEWQ